MASQDANTPRPTDLRGLEILVPRDKETPELSKAQLLVLWGLKHVVWRFWNARHHRKARQQTEDGLKERINKAFEDHMPPDITGFVAHQGNRSSVKLLRVLRPKPGKRAMNPWGWLNYLTDENEHNGGVIKGLHITLDHAHPGLLRDVLEFLTQNAGDDFLVNVTPEIDYERLAELQEDDQLGDLPDGLIRAAEMSPACTPFLAMPDGRWLKA